VFSANHVILTASSEVLKQGRIKFEPPLSQAKRDALDKTELASYVKVFVQWPTRWWN
jgi:monoamine oxidase